MTKSIITFAFFTIISVLLAACHTMQKSTDMDKTFLASPGCKADGFSYKNQQLVLNSQYGLTTQQLYFIKDSGPAGVWLDYQPLGTDQAAGWRSYIRGGKWAALAVDKKNFRMVCLARDKNEVKQFIDCEKVLQVCRAASANLLSGHQGTYWLAENGSLDDVLTSVHRQGITLMQ